jgi:hypothetical protein
MTRHLERQEILVTPEGKAKRCAPTSRGRSVNVNKLIARRQVGLRKRTVIGTGHLDPPEKYAALKLNARSSNGAVSDLTLLQSDSTRFEQSALEPPLQLKRSFAGLDDTEFEPPDCQIASGPEHLLVVVNASWAVFDKTGRQLLRRNFADLFEGLAEDPLICRPRVVYDHFRGGWLMAACATSVDLKQSWFFLASSHGPDPLGDWWIWSIDARSDESQPNLRPDSLGLAVDNGSVYLTANMFAGQGNFAYARLRVLSKIDMLGGGLIHSWDFWQLRNYDGTPAFAPQPALNLSTPEGQYLINATIDGQGLTLWKVVQSPRQLPVLTRKFMPTIPFMTAPNVRQQRIEREIETGDTRLCQPVYRHGQLWVAHTVAVKWGERPNSAGIQWFQANSKAGYVTRQGIFGAPDYHYFSPAVMVDRLGSMIVVFNRVGESDPPAICYAVKSAMDDPSRLQDSVEMIQSSMSGACEWNSSNSAAIDHEEEQVWMMGQYVATESDWATWIGSIKPGAGQTRKAGE